MNECGTYEQARMLFSVEIVSGIELRRRGKIYCATYVQCVPPEMGHVVNTESIFSNPKTPVGVLRGGVSGSLCLVPSGNEISVITDNKCD